MDDLEKDIKMGFLDNADHLLAEVEPYFLGLEVAVGNPEKRSTIFEQIAELAQDLNSSSGLVGFEDLRKFTQVFESLILKVKTGEREFDSQMAGLLLTCNDRLRRMLADLRQNLGARFDNTEFIAKMTATARENVQVGQESLDRLLHSVGELVINYSSLAVYQNALGSLSDDVKLSMQINQLGKIARDLRALTLGLRGVSQNLTIFDGMVVRIGDERYVVPMSHVSESVRPRRQDVTRHDDGPLQMMDHRGESIPVFLLGSLLGRRSYRLDAWEGVALIVRGLHEKPFSLLVDDIVGSQQVVIKPLGADLKDLPGLAGAAILGDGDAALVLDIGQIVEVAA